MIQVKRKLARRFIGPFTILARIGKVAYRLALPPGMSCHNVFHVRLLKKWIAQFMGGEPPSSIFYEDNPEWEVEAITGHKYVGQKSSRTVRYCIRWKGYPPEHDSWVKESRLAKAGDILSEYWESLGGRPS